MSQIRFENIDEEIISKQQKELLEEYFTVYLKNGITKKKEFSENGILMSVVFYKETETLSEIFNLYPTISNIEVREREYIGVYTKIHNKHYFDGTINLYSVSVIDQHENMIYEGKRDLVSGVITGELIKSYYINNESSEECLITYNSNGTIKRMTDELGYPIRANDVSTYFGNNWQNMAYYHNATPIIPI
jgi:hypothetical protein